MCFTFLTTSKSSKLHTLEPLEQQHPLPSTLSAHHTPSSTSSDTQSSTTSSSSLADIKNLLAADATVMYGLREICKATHNFTHEKIGDSVWKSTIRNVAVTVKKLQHGSVGSFQERLASVCSVHHGSLVKLLGACKESQQEQQVYLVYEFIEGADLRGCIRSSRAPGYSALPTWRSRIQVAVDVAKGLEYLHHHTRSGFIQKYVDSSKILVDNNLRAKIACFGVAELGGEVEKGGYGSVKICGTQGYMAPEYIVYGVMTQKYDVFAFAVVLLELLSGQEPVSYDMDASGNLIKKALG